MTEERLKEIKDSIDFQLEACKIFKQDNELTLEELELYNEVVRLREENKKLKSVNSYSKRELYKFNKERLEANLKLVKEIDRLRGIIDKAIKDIEENTHNVYVSDYRDKWGSFENVDKTPIIAKIYRKNPNELLDILEGEK